MRFLKSTPVRIVVIALAVQAALLYAISRTELQPTAPPLASFPMVVGDWQLSQEGYVDEETRSVLQADDLLSRLYTRTSDQAPANLFIAAFRSQRTGKAPHSPKNCLPGAGWMQDKAGTSMIDVPGHAPIEVNEYVVSKGEARSVVLYWYQSRDRVVASEYNAKMFVVLDSMRYNRTDTALVRVVVPARGHDDEGASRLAGDFVKAVFPALHEALPQ